MLSRFNGKIRLIYTFFRSAYIASSSCLFIIGDSHWIDVCQNNGNLLASCGLDEDVKIFDKRESKIVQTFNGIHESNSFQMT